MTWPFFRSARHLRRYRRLAAVLTRHGLGWLVDQASPARFLRQRRRLFRRAAPVRPYPSLAQRLCRVLEEMGPTFVLLGRYLSTRVDLLPPALCQELARLPEGPPAMPVEEVTRILEEELGRPSAELFAELDPVPWRCTWLEQLHRARTPDGQEVLVALPNREVRSRWEQEWPMLRDLARLVEELRLPGTWRRTRELVQDFGEAVRQEMDARERGRNAERWRKAFLRREPAFPQVDWGRTTVGVLTCSCLPGRPFAEVAAAEPGRREDLARALYRFYGQAIFRHGFYPAPPLLGGLAVLEGEGLVATAFAPAGHLGDLLRQGLLRLLTDLKRERVEGIISSGVSLGLLEHPQVSTAVQQAVRHLSDRYHDLPLAELRLVEVARDLFALAGRGTMALPEDLALLLRTLVAVEELGRRLAPHVAPAEELAPAVRRAMARLGSWKARRGRLLQAGGSWLEALGTFPGSFRRLLAQMLQGDLLVGVELEGWQKPMRRLERMVHRLVLAVVTAGVLFAVALLVTTMLPARWSPWGWIPAGLVLFSLAGLTLLLVLTFLRRFHE